MKWRARRSQGCSQRRSGRERATDTIDLLPSRDRIGSRHTSHRRLDRVPQLPLRRIVERDRNTHPRRQASDVGATGGTGARRQRRRQGEARFETHILGKFLRTEELKQAEESVGIVLEWGGAQEQDVAADAGDGRYCAPAGLAWVARRAA